MGVVVDVEPKGGKDGVGVVRGIKHAGCGRVGVENGPGVGISGCRGPKSMGDVGVVVVVFWGAKACCV